MRENTRTAAASLELWQSGHDQENLCAACFLSTALLLNDRRLTTSNYRAAQMCCVGIHQLEHKSLRKVPLVKKKTSESKQECYDNDVDVIVV